MINSLITNMSELMTQYQNQVLENAPDEMTKQYRISQEATNAIAKEIFNSEPTSGNSESGKVSELKQYDLLIQKAEDLEILMKINEATKAIETDLIESQVNAVVTFLRNEVMQNKNHQNYILGNLKTRDHIYIEFLARLSVTDASVFYRNTSFLMSHCGLSKRKEIAFAIAKFGLGVGARNLIQNIGRFSFDKEEDRKEIALMIATQEYGARVLCYNLDKLSIADEMNRKKIILAIAKHKVEAEDVIEYIKKNPFESEKDNKEIALALARHKKGCNCLLENIDKISVTNESYRKEIALAIATHCAPAEKMARNIERFSFTDEEDRTEVALAIAVHWPCALDVIKNIEKFSIVDIANLKKIAVKSGEHGLYVMRELSNDIKKFSRTAEDRKEIALSIAQNEEGADGLVDYIEQFFLSDEDLRVIVFTIANHYRSAFKLVENIEKFPFLTEEDRKEIALVIARHEWGAEFLLECLSDLSIKSEKYLKEIAMVMANHDKGAGDVVSLILEGVISYTEEADGKKIALAILQHAEGAKALIENYKSFNITDKDFEREAIRMAFRWPSSLEAVKIHLRESEALKDDLSLDLMRRCPAKSDLSRNKGINERKKVLVDLMGGKWEKTQKAVKSLSEKVDSDDSNFKTIEAFYDLDSAKRPKFQDYKKACNKLSYKFNKSKDKELAKLAGNLIQEGQYWASVYDVIEQVAQQNDRDLQYNLTHWLAYSSFRLMEANREVDTGTPAHAQVLKMIYNVRDQDLRYHLADLFAEQMSDQKDLKTLMTPPSAALTKLLLYDLQKIHPEIKFDKFTKSLTTRFLKDGEKQKILYNALWELKQSRRVSSEQINDILEHLSGLDSEGLVHELRALNSIISLEKEDRISFTDKEKKPLKKSLFDAFAELMPGLNISDPSCFSDLYFGSREPGALAVYIAGLLKLPPSESEALLKIVKTFVEEVDGGSFLTSRYQDSDHLNRVAEGDPNIFEMWKTGKQGPLADYLEGNSDPDVVEAIMNSLKIKIMADRHLPIERLPLVAQAYGEEVDSSEPFEALDTLLFHLIQKPDLLTADYLDKILIELKELPKDDVLAFTQDVESFKEELKPKAAKKIERWQIVDSDDPLDLFLSGTEVGGSCQRVDGKPRLNKALMGYVMDGKHRILAVKDERGKIVERLILRLLLDEETNEPVLFFERIYPKTANYGDALKNFAKERARELGVPLVSKETRAETKYKGSLVSYSSKAPYEYSDAAGGIQTGRFEITDCYQIAA